MAGADTVLVDDPLLTARAVCAEPPAHAGGRRLAAAGAARRAGVGADAADRCSSSRDRRGGRVGVAGHVAGCAARGIEVLVAPVRTTSRPSCRPCTAREIRSVLVEGGAVLHRACVDAGLADRRPPLRDAARAWAAGRGLGRCPVAWSGPPSRVVPLGPDVLIEPMFTGLIESVGRVARVEQIAGGIRLHVAIAARGRAADGRQHRAQRRVPHRRGARRPTTFATEISPETLRVTNLGDLVAGLAGEPRAAAAPGRPHGRPLRAGARGRHGPGDRHRDGGRVLAVLLQLPARARAAVHPEGLDRRGWHQPHGRGAARRASSTCRSSRSRGSRPTCTPGGPATG